MDHLEFTPHPADPALRLPPATYFYVLHTLRGLLPPPVGDTPQDFARRDDAAIAQVAAMLPVNRSAGPAAHERYPFGYF